MRKMSTTKTKSQPSPENGSLKVHFDKIQKVFLAMKSENVYFIFSVLTPSVLQIYI